jgi:FixJ family two-component response regulator
VVLNLVRDAAKAIVAIDDRARTLTLTTARDGDHTVTIRVRDVGVGLQGGAPSRRSEAFYKIKLLGIEIGLALSCSIVESHSAGRVPSPTPAPRRRSGSACQSPAAWSGRETAHRRPRSRAGSIPGVAGVMPAMQAHAGEQEYARVTSTVTSIDPRAARSARFERIRDDASTGAITRTRGRGEGAVRVSSSSGFGPALTDAPIVFVVDDDISVRESLDLLIRSAGWRVETFASGHEFFARPLLHAASCMLLDIAMPSVDGLELQKRLAVERPSMPIIFVTGHGDVPRTVQAMKGGAVEFLTKPLHADVLLSAIGSALDRSRTALATEDQLRVLRDGYASLSMREREVMALVVAGLLNKQVGAELGISEITVKAHRGSVMRKMKATSLPELVTMSARLGVGDGARTPSPAADVAPRLQR